MKWPHLNNNSNLVIVSTNSNELFFNLLESIRSLNKHFTLSSGLLIILYFWTHCKSKYYFIENWSHFLLVKRTMHWYIQSIFSSFNSKIFLIWHIKLNVPHKINCIIFQSAHIKYILHIDTITLTQGHVGISQKCLNKFRHLFRWMFNCSYVFIPNNW